MVNLTITPPTTKKVIAWETSCSVSCDLNHGDFKIIFYIRLIKHVNWKSSTVCSAHAYSNELVFSSQLSAPSSVLQAFVKCKCGFQTSDFLQAKSKNQWVLFKTKYDCFVFVLANLNNSERIVPAPFSNSISESIDLQNQKQFKHDAFHKTNCKCFHESVIN